MAQAPNDTTPTMFTVADAKRVLAAVKAFERQTINEKKLPEGRDNDRAIRYAVVTEFVSQYDASTKTLGLLKARLQYRSSERKLVAHSPEIIVDVDIDIVGTLPAGRQIKIIIVDGSWSLFTAACA